MSDTAVSHFTDSTYLEGLPISFFSFVASIEGRRNFRLALGQRSLEIHGGCEVPAANLACKDQAALVELVYNDYTGCSRSSQVA